MDSLTQGLLGATTFAVVKDKAIGKKSLLIGAIAGTIPDLDVFFAPFFNDVAFLSVHRSISHSIGFAVLLSILLGAIFHRIYQKKYAQKNWILAFFLAIITHSLLDWCTTYGTKLLSPFNAYLFSLNNIHTIEPIYTLILFIGLILLLFKRSFNTQRQKIIQYTLLLSTAYLAWTFVSKSMANRQFVQELERQELPYEKLMVSPTPLNSILWHGIAKTPNGYYLATYSLLDKRDKIEFHFEESAHELLPSIEQNRLVHYFLDYTQDFPLVKKDASGNIQIYAIKYGPINYFGTPEFVYPLCLHEAELKDEKISIDYSRRQKGPVKNYKNLWKRIQGI